MNTKNFLREVMLLAWQFVKRNGFTMAEAMRTAWLNMKLKAAMAVRIVKFYFQKVDGSLRESYGTLKDNLLPTTGDGRKANPIIQTYYDTEKQEWRCFKRANLISVVL